MQNRHPVQAQPNYMRSSMRLSPWCAVAVLCALAAGNAHAAAVKVQEILSAGSRVLSTDRILVSVARAAPVARSIKVLDNFEAGTRFILPAAVSLRLRSENGVNITLFASTDYTVEAVLPNGEVHSVFSGAARFSLSKVFNFFNVDLHAYVARVWGTEFEVNTDAEGNVFVSLLKGVVACTTDETVRADDRWITTEIADVLSEDGLRAVGYSRDAGDYLRKFDSYVNAVAFYREKLREAQAHGRVEGLLAGHNNLGQTLLAIGNPAAAKEQFSESEALARQQKDLPWQARMLNNLAAVEITVKNYPAAVALLEQALTINRKLYPHGVHKRIGHNLVNLAIAQRRMGQTQEALANLHVAMDIATALTPDGYSAELAAIHETLGNTLIDQPSAGASQGLGHLLRAQEIRARLFGTRHHPDVAEGYNSLGVAYRKLKQPVKALEFHRLALAQRETLFGSRPHPKVADSWINVGNAQFELADLRGALASFQQALAIESALADRGPRLADTYTRIARVWQALGDSAKQEVYESEARKALRNP